MDIVRVLKEAVSIDSTYPHEAEFGIFMKEKMEEIGMKVRKQRVERKRHNIIGEIGEGDHTIILLGHLDTVPPAEGWDDPFFLKVNGRRATGLGASDMKGGIVSGLSSLESYEGNARIKLALMVDEENESLGSWKFVNSSEAKADFCISLETGMGIGPSSITAGRRGRVMIKVTFVSTSRHLMEKERVNAISEMASFISQLDEIQPSIHEELGMGSIEPVKIYTQAKGLSFPEKASVYIDYFYVPPETPRLILEKIKEKMRLMDISCPYKVEFAERRTPFLRPYITDTSNFFVQQLLRAVQPRFRRPHFSYARSVSDENRLAEIMPTVAIGPKGGNEHAPGEWVDIKSLYDLSDILKRFYKLI